jgi:hypothetical protein
MTAPVPQATSSNTLGRLESDAAKKIGGPNRCDGRDQISLV